jgi:FkbM family methyltransferase
MGSSRHLRQRRHKWLGKLSKWLGYQLRVARRSVVTIEGVRIRIGRHMSPRIERAVSEGSYEREELRLVEPMLSPSDVVLEVGAGLGVVSAYCAMRLGSNRVFAYEANPDLEDRIRETYALNGVQPTLEMCAVGAASGIATLYRERHLWSSSLTRRSHAARPIRVPVKSLNDIVQRIRPTFLIIDAEGTETELFERADLPTVTGIVLELHERIIGAANVRRVRSILTASGFEEVPGLSERGHAVLRRASISLPDASQG